MAADTRSLLEALVRQHARAVGAICWARIGDVEAVDELVQETMFRACRDFGGLREQEKFGGWVRGIAENVCHEWFRARKKRPGALGPEADVAAPEPPEPTGDVDRMRAALGALPEIYRDTLALFHFEKKTYSEIGELQGIGAAAVNARLTRGRALLRDRLKGVTHDVR